jgi:hypothetical protein
MATRIGQKIAAIERATKAARDPDNVIIFTPGPGEPEASIQRFCDLYPDYRDPIIVLPDNGRDDFTAREKGHTRRR